MDDHINREGYKRLYLILENTGLDDYEIPFNKIPKEFTDAGLHTVVCRPNFSLKPNFEFMSAFIKDKDIDVLHEIYFSIYEPVYLANMSDVEITQYEKDLLYAYTSTHWDMLMDCYRKLYSDEFEVSCIHDYTNKDCTKVILPKESPDYRLLPAISPKDI